MDSAYRSDPKCYNWETLHNYAGRFKLGFKKLLVEQIDFYKENSFHPKTGAQTGLYNKTRHIYVANSRPNGPNGLKCFVDNHMGIRGVSYEKINNIAPGNNQSAFIFEPYRNSCFRSNSLCTACYPLLSSSFSCFLSNISCFRFSSYFSCENLFNISVKNSCLTYFECFLWEKRYYLSPGWFLDAGLQHPVLYLHLGSFAILQFIR